MRNLIRYYKALLSCKAELTEFAGYGECEEEFKELLAHVAREERRVADLLDEKEKPATLCTYSWSEDGEIELCTQTEDFLKEDTVCDYCDNNIKAGEKTVFLFSIDDSSEYVLHSECAKKGCSPHKKRPAVTRS